MRGVTTLTKCIFRPIDFLCLQALHMQELSHLAFNLQRVNLLWNEGENYIGQENVAKRSSIKMRKEKGDWKGVG
jgi:hypothetical protein